MKRSENKSLSTSVANLCPDNGHVLHERRVQDYVKAFQCKTKDMGQDFAEAAVMLAFLKKPCHFSSLPFVTENSRRGQMRLQNMVSTFPYLSSLNAVTRD